LVVRPGVKPKHLAKTTAKGKDCTKTGDGEEAHTQSTFNEPMPDIGTEQVSQIHGVHEKQVRLSLLWSHLRTLCN
jgi:hypothetical protein